MKINFGERLKSRVAAAADAARQFKTLDQMAAQDEYIHSPDLNVKSGGRRETKSSPKMEEKPPEEPEPVHPKSLLEQSRQNGFSPPRTNESPSRAAASYNREEQTTSSILNGSRQATTMPLLSVVTDVMSVSSKAESASERQSIGQGSSHIEQLDFSDDDSLGDGIEGDDPILNMMRNNESVKSKNSSVSRDFRASHSSVEEKRNPNRFMEELDRRLSLPPDIESGQEDGNVEHSSSKFGTGRRSPRLSLMDSSNKWEWMKRAASSHVNKILKSTPQDNDTRLEMAPLTSSPTQKQPRDPNDDFQVTVSSSMLGAEEQAELERIRRLATHSHPLTIVLETARQNPQFVFIAFTIVLGSAAYFYSRTRGSEDGVP